LDDLKNVGESNYNPGDGTDQTVQSLVFMMTVSSAETRSFIALFPFFLLSLLRFLTL